MYLSRKIREPPPIDEYIDSLIDCHRELKKKMEEENPRYRAYLSEL